jgi:hypothetical protein
MDMAHRVNVGSSLVNPRVNPEFGIRPAFAGQLVAVRVEHEQIVFSDERRTHARRKYESVGAGDARAYMAKRRGDSLPVENMTCSDNI